MAGEPVSPGAPPEKAAALQRDVASLETELRREDDRRRALEKALSRREKLDRKQTLREAEKRKYTDAERGELRRTFSEFDRDGSGHIEPKELLAMSKQLGCAMSDDELAEAIKALDVDEDGRLSFDEFVQWWGSDKKLGGNKGVKLALMKARLLAERARATAVRKLGKVAAADLSGRIIESTTDIIVGDEGDFAPALSAQLTILPTGKSLFESEGQRTVRELAAAGPLKYVTDPAKWWQRSVGADADDDPEPVMMVARVSFAILPTAEQPAIDAALRKYYEATELAEDGCAEAKEREDACSPLPPLPYFSTQPDGERLLHFVALFRKGQSGPTQGYEELRGKLDEVLLCGGAERDGDGAGSATDQPDKIFESVAASIQSEVDPGEWLKDDKARVADLFRRMRGSKTVRTSRGMLELMQKAFFARQKEEVIEEGWVADREFKKAATAMLGIAMSGHQRVRLRLASPALAFARVARSFGTQHRARVEAKLAAGDMERDENVDTALADGAVERAWHDLVGECLGPTAAEIRNLIHMKLGKAASGPANAEMYDAFLAPLREALRAPVQVQVLTPLACATVHLKGFGFVRDLLPASSEGGGAWRKESEEALERGEELHDAFREGWTGWVDADCAAPRPAAPGAAEAALGTRKLCFAGMRGAGKTSLIHRLSTGAALADPAATTAFTTCGLPRTRPGRFFGGYSAVEYWNAEGDYDGVPAHMLSATDTAKCLVWLVDAAKGVRGAEERAAFRDLLQKLDIARESAGHLLVVVASKADTAPSTPEPDKVLADLLQGHESTMEQLRDRKCVAAVAASAADADSAEAVVRAVQQLEAGLQEAECCASVHDAPLRGATQRIEAARITMALVGDTDDFF